MNLAYKFDGIDWMIGNQWNQMIMLCEMWPKHKKSHISFSLFLIQKEKKRNEIDEFFDFFHLIHDFISKTKVFFLKSIHEIKSLNLIEWFDWKEEYYNSTVVDQWI